MRGTLCCTILYLSQIGDLFYSYTVVILIKTFMKRKLLFVKKRWIWIVIIVLILIFVGFRIYSKPKAKKKTFYTVQNQTLQNILALSGFVDARSKAVLHFQTGGRLSWVGVKEGDMVKKY